MTEFERNALGVSKEYLNHLIERNKYDINMLVASILSDIQEMLPEDGDMITSADRIRKSLNVAKYILFETQEERV